VARANLAAGLTPLDIAETIRHDVEASPLIGGEQLTSGVPA
jgi:hypothetical protein